MRDPGTTVRRSSARFRSSPAKPSTRDQSPTYIDGVLGLEAAHALEGVRECDPPALQEQLARQEGPG